MTNNGPSSGQDASRTLFESRTGMDAFLSEWFGNAQQCALYVMQLEQRLAVQFPETFNDGLAFRHFHYRRVADVEWFNLN